MARLRFLASALAKGVTGARQGQIDRARVDTQAARTAAESELKQRHEAALERFQEEQLKIHQGEVDNRRTQLENEEASRAQAAEKERLEIDKLRHPNKYRTAPAPSFTDQQKQAALRYRDALMASPGMTLEKANQMMKNQFPFAQTGFDALEAKIGGAITQQP